jgi:hypothetical protein
MRTVAGSLPFLCGLLGLGVAWAAPPAIPVKPPSVLRHGELVVGSDRGLEIWNVDGTIKRTVTRTPAPHPRWLNDTTVLVVEGVDLHGEPGQPVIFSKIDLQTGRTTLVAKVQPIGCAKEVSEFEVPGMTLGLRQELDFVADPSRNRACVSLSDGGENLTIFMGIDLATGAIHQIVETAPSGCHLPNGVKTQDIRDRDDCARHSNVSGAGPIKANALAFEFKGHSILKLGVPSKRGRVTARLPEYQEEALESLSPSGRWQLLSGEIEEHDFTYRKLVLIDKRSGAVFPLPKEHGAWPSPVRPGARKAIHVPSGTLTATGESDVRWMGFDESTEVLVVDQLIFRPGVAAFSVQGNVAR